MWQFDSEPGTDTAEFRSANLIGTIKYFDYPKTLAE
jgi:hypothetical protein